MHGEEHLVLIFSGILLFHPKLCNMVFHSSPSGLAFTMEVFTGDPPYKGMAQLPSHISLRRLSWWMQRGNHRLLIAAGWSSLYCSQKTKFTSPWVTDWASKTLKAQFTNSSPSSSTRQLLPPLQSLQEGPQPQQAVRTGLQCKGQGCAGSKYQKH